MQHEGQARRHFASDNWAGVHPEIIEAVAAANSGHVPSYGSDEYTMSVAERLRVEFGASAVFFVFTGTGANVLSLQTIAQAHNAVICADSAHIHTSECGAAEKHIGCKLLPVTTRDGKLTREGIAPHLQYFGNEHHVQPSAVSISQATEYGTVYTPDEIALLAEFSRGHGLRLHVDGARLANAAAGLGVSLAALTSAVGVDVLSFGGTKNGAMAAEAVVFFDDALAESFVFQRMQAAQLSSKMRFVAAQFDALFTDHLWLRSARHANRMGSRLGAELATLPGVQVTQDVQANEVFAILPRQHIASLQAESFFHIWDEARSEARFVTSFDTSEADIAHFMAAARTTFAAGES